MRVTVRIEDIDWNNLEKEAKKLGFTSRNELIGHLVRNQLNSETANKQLTTKQKVENAKLFLIFKKIEIAGQDYRIKKSFADYIEQYVSQFGTFPSSRGMRALSSKAKNDNVIKIAKPIEKESWIPKFATTKTYGDYYGMCKICTDSDFTAKTEDALVTKLEDHIKDDHKQEPYTRTILN